MYDELVKALRETRERVRKYPGVAMYVPPYQLSAAADAIEELFGKVEQLPRWIPVTEPPKKDGWYQVYAPGYSGGSSSGLKNINGIMYSAFKHGKWSVEVGYYKRPGCVKAWMPLPEPPKEEKK
jgi:hypothetical protein